MMIFFDEDLSAGSIICRRKFKADNNSGQSSNNDDIIPEWTQKRQEKAEKWVNNSEKAGRGECVPSVISDMLGKSLPDVRKDIGKTMTGVSEHWEFYYYYRAKKSDGFPIGTERAASLISSKCGLNESDSRSLLEEARQRGKSDDFNGPKKWEVPHHQIVVQVDGNHWGILDRIENVMAKDPSVYIIAYGYNEGPYNFSRITRVLR